jgi:DNA-binding response OmpR family regulator
MDASHKLKILYVEDDQSLASLYSLRLRNEGYEVRQCADGDSALQAGREFKPDLILVDLMMPTLNGFDAIDMFRNTMETSAAKIVVLSALNQQADIQRALDLGADEFLVKSQVGLEEVIQAVRRHLGQEQTPAPAANTGNIQQ